MNISAWSPRCGRRSPAASASPRSGASTTSTPGPRTSPTGSGSWPNSRGRWRPTRRCGTWASPRSPCSPDSGTGGRGSVRSSRVGARMSTDVTKSKAWKALAEHADEVRGQHLRDLFADDADRGTRLSAQAADLYVDYSKNLVTDQTMALLAALADEVGLTDR